MADEKRVMTAKSLLRKQLNSVVRGLPKLEILRQSERVTEKVLNNVEFEKAEIVSVYLSMDNEIQTDAIVKEIFKRKKECFIPRFQQGNPVMEMIHLSSLEQYNALPRNKWNIKQPPDDVYCKSVFDIGRLDIVLTPGLGFTMAGHRLGRGKGYYDTFFEMCKDRLPRFPYTIGLAFKEQILPEIPTQAHDYTLDLIIASE